MGKSAARVLIAIGILHLLLFLWFSDHHVRTQANQRLHLSAAARRMN